MKNRKCLIYLVLCCWVLITLFTSHQLFNINDDKSRLVKQQRIYIDHEFDEYAKYHCPVEIINASKNCLNQLAKYDIESLNETDDYEIVYYHTFWYNDKPLGEYEHQIMILNINSYLATQDLIHTKLIIWLKRPLLDQPFYDLFRYYVDKQAIGFKVIDLHELCSIELFKEKYSLCVSEYMDTVSTLSDFVRFLVLNYYGGIYADGDVMYLRDMKPFWNKNFVHRWSHLNTYNTAVMGISKHQSKSIKLVYNSIVLNQKRYNILLRFFVSLLSKIFNVPEINERLTFLYEFLPWRVAETVSTLNNRNIYDYADLTVHHSALFDPLWLIHDNKVKFESPLTYFHQFFKANLDSQRSKSIETFFNGAFTYHLHYKICENCLMQNKTFFKEFYQHFQMIVERKKIEKQFI